MNISDLKRLAGITNTVNATDSPVPENRGAIMKEHDIKPGTDEWFKLWFPLNDTGFPPGFRGRVKRR